MTREQRVLILSRLVKAFLPMIYWDSPGESGPIIDPGEELPPHMETPKDESLHDGPHIDPDTIPYKDNPEVDMGQHVFTLEPFFEDGTSRIPKENYHPNLFDERHERP